MSEPKLYKVVFQTEIMILAETEAEAIKGAESHVSEETPMYLESELVTSESQLGVWAGCLPYEADYSKKYNENENVCRNFI